MTIRPFPSRVRPGTKRRRRGRGVVHGLLGSLLLVSLTGCATKGDLRDLREELQVLAERQEEAIRSLQELSFATQDTLSGQSESLITLRGETLRSLNQIQDDLSILMEMAGQNQRDIALIRDQMQSGRAGSMAAGAAGAALVRTDSAGGGEMVEVQATAGGAEAMYQAGVRQLNRGSLSAARMAFEEFLVAYPSHPSAPSAHLYLADILVQEEDLDGALEAFLEVQELFPTSPEVPQALYRAALLHVEMGDPDEARVLLERVVNSYPDSGAAILAREKLRELG